MFTSTYTFAKQLGDQPGGGGFGFFGGGGGWTDPMNRNLDYRISGYSARHQWNNYGMMDLPLGANGYFLRGVQNGIVKRFIEGWQFSWTMRMQSGSKSQISGGTNHLYSSATLMNLVGPKELAPGNSHLDWAPGASQGYYYGSGNTAKYIIAADPQCDTNSTVVAASLRAASLFSTTGSCTLSALYLRNPDGSRGQIILQNSLPGHQGNFTNYIEGLGSFNLDMGMTKSIQLTEGKSLNIRMNASNILNHPSPYSPGFQIGGAFSSFGVTGMKSGNRTFQGNISIRF